jgi:hypothetical protein
MTALPGAGAQASQPAASAADPGFPRAAAYAALFCSAMGLSSLAGVMFVRSGLPTPPLLAPYCAVLLLAVMFAPFLLPARCLTLPQGRLPAAPAVCLLVLCLPLLAYLHPAVALAATVGAALLGLVRGLRWLGGFPLAGWLLVLAGAPLAALHVFPVDSLNYVLAAETAPLGLLDNATYFQTTVSQMIQSHGVPSVGADGLRLLHYHFGSHLWFAGIGLATGAMPLYVYAYAQLAILLPALYLGVLLAAGALMRCDFDRVSLTAIGIALLAGFDAFISRTHINSESFTFSLAAALLVLPLIFGLHEAPAGTRAQARGVAGLWIAALLAVALITALKVSTGYVLVGTLAYAAWRRYGFGWPAWAVAAALVSILLCAKLFFSPRGFVIGDPMILLSSYQQYFVPDTFFTLLLPAVLVLTAWYQPRLRPAVGGGAAQSHFDLALNRVPLRARLLGLRQAPRRREELWLVATAVAFLPVVLLPIGSNAVYFSAMPHWLLLPAAVAWLAGLAGAGARGRYVLAAVLTLAVVTLTLLPVKVDMKGMRAFLSAVDDGAPGPKLMHEPQAMKRFFAANLAGERVLFSREFVDKMQQNPWQQFVADLRATARDRGAGFAVFVPPSNHAFWNKLEGSGPYWCADMHLFIPSQTGAAMVKGLQPLDQVCTMFGPGAPDYGPDSHTAEISDPDLCHHAAALHITSIRVLESVPEPGRNRTISCNSSK